MSLLTHTESHSTYVNAMSMLSLGKDKQWIDSPSEMDMENMHVSQIPEYE